MNIDEVKNDVEQNMQRSIKSLKNDLAKIRTGRAHTGLLDHIQVDYCGSVVPISKIANLILVDVRTIGVQLWEKNMAPNVEKVIREANLGLNPSSCGDLIRVSMPALTEEGRREMTKIVKVEGEMVKVIIRNFRRDANEALKKLMKNKEISRDIERRANNDIQKLTDKYVAEVDKLVQLKESEIMTI
ncbi:MAG: ribosome recycling factor [Burkholderia sp.]|nr:ribosome recycling factor [Burkholderia sp.]